MSTYANPLYERLTRGAKPTVTQTALLTLILLTTSTVLIVRSGTRSQDTLAEFMLVEATVILLVPSIAAAIAARITASDAGNEAFTVQKLTLLTREGIVRGYLFATLFRVRLLFVLIVVLLPMVLPPSINFDPSHCHIFDLNWPTPSRQFYGGCVQSTDFRFILEDISHIILLLVLLLAVLPGALAGIAAGLALKRVTPAILLSVPAALIVMAGFAALIRFKLSIISECIEYCVHSHPWPDPLFAAFGSLIVLSGLIVGLRWLARRAV